MGLGRAGSRRLPGVHHEHGLLFVAVLERLGFAVTGLSARVAMGTGRPRPPTHMCLRAEAGGDAWLADVGFGGDGLLEPIPLRPGQRVRHGDGAWQYALTRQPAGTWALRSLWPRGWLEMYTFALEPRWPVDYQVFNWYTATYPRSPFTQRPVVQKAGDSLRRSLVGGELTVGPPRLGSRDTRRRARRTAWHPGRRLRHRTDHARRRDALAATAPSTRPGSMTAPPR